MKLWQWEHGRQNSEYSKFTIAFSKTLRFDAYIIVIPYDSEVPEHTDPAVPGFEHHRVNITLKRPRQGGFTFIQSNTGKWERERSRAYHFRPDERPHRVSKIREGNLVLLSFGWLRTARTVV